MLELVSADKETRKTPHGSIVGFWHKGELPQRLLLCRYWSNSGHRSESGPQERTRTAIRKERGIVRTRSQIRSTCLNSAANGT